MTRSRRGVLQETTDPPQSPVDCSSSTNEIRDATRYVQFTKPLVTLTVIFEEEQPEDWADIVDEDDGCAERSRLDVGVAEDAVVRPKKRSITEALRFLSRQPPENPDEWITVNGQTDEGKGEDGDRREAGDTRGARASDKIDDTDIFTLEDGEKKCDEPPPKYLEEDIDKAKIQAPTSTDSATNPLEGPETKSYEACQMLAVIKYDEIWDKPYCQKCNTAFHIDLAVQRWCIDLVTKKRTDIEERHKDGEFLPATIGHNDEPKWTDGLAEYWIKYWKKEWGLVDNIPSLSDQSK
ncbi:hypothetical protein B0I35DRAFT_485418 [Stachybotrys elegans]|uniref:Uncharacterized protein n=1 Tax=Stachybotrys elegans TaxID=80388 RepID=A0A8K0SCH2_9HYPO|nr:hypothetical protein B0I35DRAFT_485418 [Stachybotrys elegans]